MAPRSFLQMVRPGGTYDDRNAMKSIVSICYYLRDSFTTIVRDQLFAKVHNPLLDQVTNPLIGILHSLDLLMERLDGVLREAGLVLGAEVLLDLPDNLGRNVGQDVQQVIVLVEVLEEDVDVLLHLLLDGLTVHGDDEAVDVTEGDQDHGRAHRRPLHPVPELQDALGVLTNQRRALVSLSNQRRALV